MFCVEIDRHAVGAAVVKVQVQLGGKAGKASTPANYRATPEGFIWSRYARNYDCITEAGIGRAISQTGGIDQDYGTDSRLCESFKTPAQSYAS